MKRIDDSKNWFRNQVMEKPQMKLRGRALYVLLTASLMALSGVTGCAEEVGEIDRTQPNKTKKSELKGHWYMLQTITDVPVQSAQGFVGLTNFGNNPKVMFEVTEHYLYVVPVTEAVVDAEAPYKIKKVRNYWDADKSMEFVEMYVGQPVAAYPIESHFDVIRDYNPATGKQSNVVVENSTDRLWHEREFMRVNWGGNGLLDWAFAQGSAQFSPVDHYVQEGEDQFLKPEGAGANPDLPEFEDNYISFVTKAFMPPSGADWQGYACSPYGISNKDCAGSVIKVRHSFRKAPVNNDYETFLYTNGEHMDKFGFFLSTRYAYDDLWNLTEGKRDYKAQRWNLWQKTWDRSDLLDENGDLISCTRDSDCPNDSKVLDYSGVQCIKPDYFATGKCVSQDLMKFAERGLNPIVYHISAGFDSQGCPEGDVCISDELEQVYYQTADEWSRVFKSTVAWLMALEEDGKYWTRACDTDTDCTASRMGNDVLVDQVVDMPKQMALHPDMGCPAGSAGVGDQCLSGVACASDNPCALSQLCDSDGGGGTVCFHKNEDGTRGAQVLEPVLIPGVQSATFVVHPKTDGTYGIIPVRDDYLGTFGDATTNIQMGGNEAAIRFVNASDSAATLDGVTGAIEPATGWVQQAYVTTAGTQTLKVSAGGSTVAEATVDLTPGWIYIAAFVNGDTLAIAGSKINAGSGVRYFHAIPGMGPVDTGLTSIRASQNLVFGGLSEYLPNRFNEQRATVLTAGSEGDVSCYYVQHEGRCVGWAGNNSDADARYEQILNELPEMYVVCENQYDPAGEAWRLDDARDRDLTTVYHDGRYSTVGKNPYAPAGQRDLEEGEVFNPCKHFVQKPESLKKIGDIRYNFLYWVGVPQASSPLGYGPSGGDPETGQLIWGNAYLYGAPLVSYGQSSADLVDLINGRLDPSNVINGEYIREYILSKGDPLPSDNTATLYSGAIEELAHVHGTRPQDVFHTHGQFDKDGRVIGALKDPLANQEVWDFINNDQYRKQLLRGLPQVNSDYSANRMEKVRGTHLEDLMLSEEVRLGLLSGDDSASQPLTAAMRKQLSPASWAHSSHLKGQDRQRTRVMSGAPCTYDTEFVDDNIYGLAKEHFCTDEEFAQYQADETSLGGKVCKSGDDLRWELTRRIFKGVLEHEIGHTVSLRHNFAGSVDVFNYFDEFYQIREKENVLCQVSAHCDEDTGETCEASVACASTADCPGRLSCQSGVCADAVGTEWGACSNNGQWVTKFVPRTVQTKSEAEQKLTEYQYSTIMDYGGRFNSDVQGLGKYDEAAIRFGYGKLVDIYTDADKIRDRINQMSTRYGRDPSYFGYLLSTANWRFAGTIFHPFNYLEDYIGVEQNLQRSAASYEKVKLERAMQDNYQDDLFYTTYVEVPYRFCSDEFRGNLGCYTWDTGIDIGEIVANALNQIDEYYIIDAFKRESMYRGSDNFVFSYYARVLSRYMNVMGDAGRYFAIYDNIFNDRQWYPDFIVNPYAMATLANASRTSFNNLAQILSQPAPGSFARDAEGVFRNLSYDTAMEGAELSIPLGVGKFPFTQYKAAENYGYQNHVLWVGSFWLKLAALQTLTDSTFYSSSDWVGEQLEIGRSTAVGFNTLYQTEMTNLIGGIVSDSFDAFAGVVVFDEESPEGRFKARDLFNPELDNGFDTIEPGVEGLNMKVWAGVLGMANLPGGFDPSFTDSMAVFLEGGGHEFTLEGAGINKATFADPFGGKTYVAYQPNYDADRLAPAYRVVDDAQQVREQWEAATGAEKQELQNQLKRRVELLDTMRLMHALWGTLEY